MAQCRSSVYREDMVAATRSRQAQRTAAPAAPLYTATVLSPVGDLCLTASDAGLVAILWPTDTDRVPLPAAIPEPAHPILRQTSLQLLEYFAGERTTFNLPLDLRGTPFQQAVWRALCGIPFGRTTTYGDLASALGSPAASRAVGAANGRNPISIVVPCHRVVGAAGALTGFAGGLQAKAFLLAHEQEHVPSVQPSLAFQASAPDPAACRIGS